MPGEHVEVNRAHWDRVAEDWVAMGEREWRAAAPTWGLWGVPETELRLLPERLDGIDAIELGCGTGYVSGWLARAGARVVGIDVSREQLATARRLAGEHGADVSFLEADAEAVPLPDASFDLAVSEYGASLWCEPSAWLTEAFRLLRPGGRLAFLTTSRLAVVASDPSGALPVSERLHTSWFGPTRHDWRGALDEPGGIEHVLPPSAMFALLSGIGFEVLAFHEARPADPSAAVDPLFAPGWAHRFPSEQAWVARRPGGPDGPGAA